MNTRPLLPKTISSLLVAVVLGACGSGNSPESLVASSKEFMAKKDAKSAVIQLKNALQQNPNLAEARFLLGSALYESGDLRGAEIELRKALEQKHPANQVVPVLARTMLALGQTTKIIDEFGTTVLTTETAKADLKTTLSAAYSSLGKTVEAKAMLAEALQADPDYIPARLIDIRQTISKHDIPDANSKVDALLTKHPDTAEVIFMKGTLLAISGDSANALGQYRKAIEAKPTFIPAYSAAIFVLLQDNQSDDALKQLEALKKIAPKSPQTYFLDAQVNYQRKDYKVARDAVQQLLRFSPGNPNTLQLAGAIEYQLGSFIQAEAYLTRAVQSAPTLTLARRLLVATYLHVGQPVKALETIQPVIAKIENDSNFLTLAGQVYLQNGDATKAAEYFTNASKLDPENARKKTSVAIAHLAQGNAETGFQELQKISAEDKGITADLALISAHLANKKLDKALQAIDVLEKKQPDNPSTYNLRARAQLAKNDIAGARKSFDKALSLNPTFYPAIASLATLDIAEKKPNDARRRFEAALQADPKNPQIHLALAELKATTGGTPEEVRTLLEKAVSAAPTDSTVRLALIQYLLKNKDNKKALTAATDAVAAIPDKPELLGALGTVQQLSGDLNQASITFGKMASLQPASPIPLLKLAEVQFANKQSSEAVKNLKKVLEIKPDSLDAQRALIAIALESKNKNEALAIAKTIQKQRPKESVGYLLEGEIFGSDKSFPQAIEAYRTGIKETSSSDLAIRLHSTLLTSGKQTEAEKYAAAWLRDHTKDVAFHMYLGDLATANKNFGVAISHYQSAVVIQPNNALILNNLAWASAQIKSPKALEYAEKANQLAPNQPAFMDTLAMLLAEKGDTLKAIDLLKKALVSAPKATAIQLNLAKVLLKAGKKDEARKELEALEKLGEKFNNQVEVSQLLKSL